MREKITSVGDSPALVLSAEILAQLGLSIGDEIEITLVDGVLEVRPLRDEERAAKVQAAMEDVIARRAEALQQLS